MKIAIPHWQERVSPVFDVSDKVHLVHTEGGKEIMREEKTLMSSDPFSRAREVSGFGADVLICGAVSRALEMALAGAGVRVVGFICGDVQAVLSAFLCGQLADGHFAMPGYCGERQGRRFRCHREGRSAYQGRKRQ